MSTERDGSTPPGNGVVSGTTCNIEFDDRQTKRLTSTTTVHHMVNNDGEKKIHQRNTARREKKLSYFLVAIHTKPALYSVEIWLGHTEGHNIAQSILLHKSLTDIYKNLCTQSQRPKYA